VSILTRLDEEICDLRDKYFRLQAAAENILFKLEKSATITDADIRWLREAIK